MMEVLTKLCEKKLGDDINIFDIIYQTTAYYGIVERRNTVTYTEPDSNRLRVWVDDFNHIQRVFIDDGVEETFTNLFDLYFKGKQMSWVLGIFAVRLSGKDTYSMIYPNSNPNKCKDSSQIHILLNTNSEITGFKINDQIFGENL